MMSRVQRATFLLLSVALGVYAALYGWRLRELGGSLLAARTVWLAAAAALFLAFAAWRFPAAARSRIFVVLCSILLIEALLQSAAWLGLLPGINVKDKASFARVYWTGEGRGNSIRNRYGWYYPQFNLQSSNRVVVIGDSFVEAVEVARGRNQAGFLQELLRSNSPGCAVLALGNHGTSPAYHLEVLDYAERHFPPQEAIILLYLGNDITESSPVLNQLPPDRFIYYDFDAAGHAELLPASSSMRAVFVEGMERCHGSIWPQAGTIVRSHFMLAQLLFSTRDTILRARRQHELAHADPKRAEIGWLGLNPATFKTPLAPEARRALDVTLAELELLRQKCEQNHIKLRFVTIPFFPKQFYDTQHGGQWTLRLGDYDFLGPDREISAFCHSNNISMLSLADWLAARHTDVKEIRRMYLTDGVGHFSKHGHQMCAQAMYETFYANPKYSAKTGM